MKPLRIRLKNAGPFLDQSVDFTALGDMFLVTGKTGSGKTTIFNAMTYALYGRLSGGESKGIHFHSDFASATEDGFVDFEFLLGGKRHRVVRDIPGIRMTRNNTQRKAESRVSFSTWDEEKSAWIEAGGKSSEITKRIENLVGLSADEFTQIVLLPQGKFAEFLGKRPKDRRDTLSKLFPVGLYRKAADAAAEQAKLAEKELSVKRAMLGSELDGFDREQAQAKISQLEDEAAAIRTRMDEAAADIRSLGKKQAETEELLSKEKRRLALAQELEELSRKEPETERLKEALAKAKAAQQVTRTFETAERERLSLEKKRAQLSEAEAEAAQLLEKKGKIAARADEDESYEAELDAAKNELSGMEEKLSSVKELAALKETHGAALRQIQRLYEKTAPALIKAEEELSSVQEEISKSTALLSSTRELSAELSQEKLLAKLSDSAAEIALHLADGMPCPVCGSVHHPNKAVRKESHVDIDARIALNQKAEEKLSQELSHLAERQAELSRSCMAIQGFTEQIEQGAMALSVALPPRTSFPPRKEEVPRGAAFTRQQQAITDAIGQATKTAAQIARLSSLSGMNARELEETRKALTLRTAELSRLLKERQEEAARTEKELAVSAEKKRTLTEQCAELSQKEAEARFLAEKALSDSPFSTHEEAAAAYFPQEEQEEAQRTLEDFSLRIQTVRAKLGEIQKSGKSLSDIQAELSEAETELSRRTEELSRLQEQHADAIARRKAIEQKENAVRRMEAELRECEERNAPLVRLSQDINGKSPNPKGISLESWVLGTYFEEVVDAANLYFRRFSSERYSFELETERQGGNGERGLDLSIRDSYTGQSRPTDSLSGGEKFEASLCLALALTDVVQQKSGGIRLDSLFIDEGFGALDSQLLDRAVSILEDVREERTVGIISHIEALSSEIPCHIEVTRTNKGSTISVIA